MKKDEKDVEVDRSAHGKAMAADDGEASSSSAAGAGSSSTTRRVGRQQSVQEEVAQLNVTRLAEDLQLRLQITREKKEDQGQSPMTTSASHQRSSDAAGYPDPVPEMARNQPGNPEAARQTEVVISAPTNITTEEVATGTRLWTVTGSTAGFDDDSTLRARKEEPWTLRRYAYPPGQVASDKWDETLWASDGWMVRSHGKLRKQQFHPIHRCTKIDVGQLSSQRTTVLFDSRGRQVVQDDWMHPRVNTLPQVVERWRGYTFFRVNRPSEAAGSSSQEGSSMATATMFGGGHPNDGRGAAEVESDGSFERVDGL